MRARRIGRRPSVERGAVLMLFPVAVLVVLVLGGVTVDSATAFMAQRRAHGVAVDAANDAVGAGIDLARLRSDGTIALDPRRVHRVAEVAVAAAGPEFELVSVGIDHVTVSVTVATRVRRLVVHAFGMPRTARIVVRARASNIAVAPR